MTRELKKYICPHCKEECDRIWNIYDTTTSELESLEDGEIIDFTERRIAEFRERRCPECDGILPDDDSELIATVPPPNPNKHIPITKDAPNEQSTLF